MSESGGAAYGAAGWLPGQVEPDDVAGADHVPFGMFLKIQHEPGLFRGRDPGMDRTRRKVTRWRTGSQSTGPH